MASSTKPLLLHAFANSPNPLKIGIALELLGLPYRIKIWEFGDDPVHGVKGEAFAPLSENGRVPVLEDANTGVVAWESGAVMNYLRRRYDGDGKVLGGRGNGSGSGADGHWQVTEQDLVDFEKWEYLLLTTLAPFTGQSVWFRHYQSNEEARQRYEQQVLRVYGILEKQLEKSGGRSILPQAVTAVDLHYFPWCRQPEYLGLSLDEYPLMQRWISSMSEMKEVKAAYKRLYDASVEQGVATMDEEGKITTRDPGLAHSLAADKGT